MLFLLKNYKDLPQALLLPAGEASNPLIVFGSWVLRPKPPPTSLPPKSEILATPLVITNSTRSLLQPLGNCSIQNIKLLTVRRSTLEWFLVTWSGFACDWLMLAYHWKTWFQINVFSTLTSSKKIIYTLSNIILVTIFMLQC